MAKSLGMIHTANITRINLTAASADTDALEIDIAGLLTTQLERMVRQGNYFKCVGIDIALDPVSALAADASGRISGRLEYYAPTQGRCAAYRHAFKAMAEQMEMQGIPMRNNKLYDFRVGLQNPGATTLLKNQATLDGVTGLALNNVIDGASVFDVYNASTIPTTDGLTAGDAFAEGFDTLLQAGGAKTDFVLNDDVLYSGNSLIANKSLESIPFQIGYGDDDTTPTFQFRPDPALYIAIMCGLINVHIENVFIPAGQPNLALDIAVMVSGWKSIMGEPGKKGSSTKSSKKMRK